MNKIFKKITGFFNRLFGFLFTLSILSTCIVFTGYVYANSYEVLFNKDLTYSSAIEEFHAVNLLQGIRLESRGVEINLSGNVVGDYGKPEVINFSSLNKRISMIPAIVTDSQWMTRSNNGHFFVTYKENKDLESIVVYMRKSWRTIETPENLAVGQNIFIDTNKDWRYMFRIEDVVALDMESKYVISDKDVTQLVVLIEAPEESLVYLIRGSYVTVISN